MKAKGYSIAREWHASGRPEWVVRFRGERIEEPSAFRGRAAAVVRVAGHNAVRTGALVFTEKKPEGTKP